MQDIEDEFAFLDDWEERYRHVIELGKAMPTLTSAQKTDVNRIQGCVSQVWFVSNIGADGRFHFIGDSDAHIVRGLVALLLQIFNNKTALEILDIDAISFFKRIGLSENLSTQRANGLVSMIERIQNLAKISI